MAEKATRAGPLKPTARSAGRAPARMPARRSAPAPAATPAPPAGRVRAARRIAAAAAFGGGGLTAVGVAGIGLLLAEAMAARRLIETRMPVPVRAEGRYEHGGNTTATDAPLRLVMLGDSGAVGLGVAVAAQTPGALVATQLARLTGRAVDLSVAAHVGATSEDLTRQVEDLLAAGPAPDAAVIVIGANDVKHRTPAPVSVRQLSESVTRLRGAGTAVVVGTCPDLGTVRPIPQPLRTLAHRWSRQLAAAQAIAVVEAGGRAVSIGDLLGPAFAAERELMFAEDRFHPSAAGYARAVDYLLPALAGALGLPGGGGGETVGERIDLVAGVGEAAVLASENSGTEVMATLVEGAERGARGRWVRLRRGRR